MSGATPGAPLPATLRQRIRRSAALGPLLILLASLAITGLFWRNAQQRVTQELQSAFDQQVNDITARIKQNLANQALLLQSLSGFFYTVNEVTRHDFHAYFETIRPAEPDFSFSALSYLKLVAASQRNHYMAKLRQQGAPEYRIVPDGVRDVYAPITYIEPFSDANRRRLGVDPYAVDASRVALQQARDSAQVSMSAKLTQPQNAGSTDPDFVLYMPTYRHGAPYASVAERQANLTGWVAAPFRMQTLLAHTWPSNTKNIGVNIFDGPDMTPLSLFAVPAPPAAAAVDARFQRVQSLDFGGHTWRLAFHAAPGFVPASANDRPHLVAAAGTLLSLLLSFIAFSVVWRQRRRLQTALKEARMAEEQAQNAQHLQSLRELRDGEYAARLALDTARSALTEVELQKYAMDQHAIVTNTNARGHITYANDRFCEISGYAQAELRGQDHHILNSGQHPKGFFQSMYDCIVQGKVWHGEICNCAKDGRIFWLDTTVVPFPGDNGAPGRYIAISTDITKRKGVELELVQHREHLEELVLQKTDDLQNSIDMALRTLNELRRQKFVLDQHAIVTMCGINGRITYGNEKFSAISGYSPEEFMGMDHKILNSGRHPKGFFKAMYETIQRGEVWHAEVCNRAKDGRLYWLDSTMAAFMGENGKPCEYIAVRTDITERKQAEEAAHAASRSKSEFLANMSHEIRTPMNGVMGMIDILQQTELQPAQHRMLDTIHNSSTALLNIINDILDLSKIEAGKLVLENIPTHLRELTEGVAQLMIALSNTRSVELSLFVDPELPPWIQVDPTRLRQVMLNLLGNAIKFTNSQPGQPARVILRVDPCGLSDGRPGVRLCIIDNGIGMSADVLAKLFQPFTQADESTARKFGGTGLGLSITHRLVELMQGRILVRSTVGQGSEFRVEFPLQVALPEHTPATEPSLAGLHVLIVIPGAQLTPILPAYCRAAGAHVTLVSDLAQAHQQLQAPQTRPISVVLLSQSLNGEARQLALPAGVGVVRLVLRGSDTLTPEITVPARPLLYHDLIQGLAMASGRLSAVNRHHPSEHELPPRQRAPSTEEALTRQQLILLAEDNETNRDVMQAQLGLLGYAAEVAENGLLALQMWRSRRYALLLTDCHMPTMDGFELTQAIRQAEPAGTHLPIIAITANAMQGEAQRCRARGMDDYLSKPLRLKELGPMLLKWLPLSPAATATARPAALAIWDDSTLTQLVGDSPVLQRRLLEKFLLSAQTQVSAINAAAVTGELNTAASVAHTLKSAARSVGALQLGALCQAMETAAQAGDKTRCAALAPDFSPAFTQAAQAIQQGLRQDTSEISLQPS